MESQSLNRILLFSICLFYRRKYKPSFKMQHSNNHNEILFNTFESTLKQILPQINGQQWEKKYFEFFYCNYELIFSSIQIIINRYSSLQSTNNLRQQHHQNRISNYSLSSIIYYFLTKIYSYSQRDSEWDIEEKSYCFITDFYNEPILFLESLVSIFKQSEDMAIQQAIEIFQIVKKKIRESIKTVEANLQSKFIQSQIQDSYRVYRTKITVNGFGKVKFRPDDLIYSSHATYYTQTHQFYRELYRNVEKHYTKDIASHIFDQALIQFGLITYIETINLQQPKRNNSINPNTFSIEMLKYQKLADISNFEISLNFIEEKLQTSVLELKFKILEKKEPIKINDFDLKQVQVWRALSAQNLNKHLIYVQNMIHKIDTSKQLGKGAYGVINQCESYQLFNVQSINNSKIYLFKRNNSAVKKLVLTQDSYHQVPLNRQHLILSLIKQIKHKQQIKKIKKSLGLSDQRQIVGIDRMITMLEYFKVTSKNKQKQKNQQICYIVFDLAKSSLNNRSFLSHLYSSSNYRQRIYDIFYKIFQAISFLHEQLNKLYPYELNKYFKLQNKDIKGKGEKQSYEQLNFKSHNGIYHRDIKPGNIMINYNQNYEVTDLFLIDFGMAKIKDFDSKDSCSTNCGSTYYMAPEIRNGTRHNQSIDMWSAGVILIEMFWKDQRQLFSSTQIHIMNSVTSNIKKSLDSIQANQWKQCLGQMLVQHIDQRKTASQMLQFFIKHPISLKQINPLNILKEFHSSTQYNLSHQLQAGVQISQETSGFNGSITANNFIVCDLGWYLSNNTISSMERLNIALITLHHIFNTNQQVLHPQEIVTLLNNSMILKLQDPSNENNYRVVLRDSLKKKSLGAYLQTIKLARLQNAQDNSMVILSTHKCFYQFNPQAQTGYEKLTKFNYGYIVSKQSTYKDNIRVFRRLKNRFLSEEIVNELTNEGLLIQDRVYQCTLFILKRLSITHIYSNNILNKILLFLDFQTKNGRKIVLEQSKQKYQQHSLLMLFSYSFKSDKLIITFNQSFIRTLLQKVPAVFDESKGSITKLIKIISQSPYQYKFYACLYLGSQSFQQLTKMLSKYKEYSLSNKKLDLQVKRIKLFSTYLYQELSVKSAKKAIKLICESVDRAFTKVQDELNQNSIDYATQGKARSLVNIQTWGTLEQLFANSPALVKQKVQYFKHLLCKVRQILKILSIYGYAKYEQTMNQPLEV